MISASYAECESRRQTCRDCPKRSMRNELARCDAVDLAVTGHDAVAYLIADAAFACPLGKWTVTEPAKRDPPQGLGDLVARVTSAVGIQPCEGCGERQQRLNEMFPLDRK